jgi:hypothetical protein
MADTPLIDRALLESSLTDYTPTELPERPASVPCQGLQSERSGLPMMDGEPTPTAFSPLEIIAMTAGRTDGKKMAGGIDRTLAEVSSDRYKNFIPGDYNNEDAYAQSQNWASKMVNGVGKGLLLTGTTFLQSTVGLVNVLGTALIDGREASFYDNDMNRILDALNKEA